MADTQWTTNHLQAAKVVQANDDGVKLQVDGTQTGWVNYVKSLEERPQLGQIIDAEIITNAQGRSYIKAWEGSGATPTVEPPAAPHPPATRPQAPPAATPRPTPAPAAAPTPSDTRERHMARMSALKSAVAIATSDTAGPWPAEDVLQVAEQFRAWIEG